METDLYLSDLIRVCGVVVGFVATWLAAPGAIRHLYGQVRAFTLIVVGRIASAVRSVRRLVRRLVNRLRRHREVHLDDYVGMSDAVVVAVSIDASGKLDWYPTWTPRREQDARVRLEEAETRLVMIGARLYELISAVGVDTAEQRKALAELHQRVTGVESALAAELAEQMRVDGRALPIVGLGIVLSGIPDKLALNPAVGALSLVVALVFLLVGLVHFWSTGPAGCHSESTARSAHAAEPG